MGMFSFCLVYLCPLDSIGFLFTKKLLNMLPVHPYSHHRHLLHQVYPQILTKTPTRRQ